MSKKDNIAKLTFKALPFHEFLERIWAFMRNPFFDGREVSNSPLRFAYRDFVDSLLLVVAFLTFIKYLIPSLFNIDPVPLINPIYLAFLLAINAVIFSFILSAVTSCFLAPKKLLFHNVIVYQTLRAYAVINLLIVLIVALGINRIIITGDMKVATNSIDLWIGGITGTIALYLSWRLLVKPLWFYIAAHYRKGISFMLSAIVIFLSLFINKQLPFGVGEMVINKPEFCKQLFEIKKKKGEIAASVDADCFIGKCIELKPQ